MDAGLLTRIAPAGITVLDTDEVLPSETFQKWWMLAERIDSWPAAQQPPGADTQVRTLSNSNPRSPVRAVVVPQAAANLLFKRSIYRTRLMY